MSDQETALYTEKITEIVQCAVMPCEHLDSKYLAHLHNLSIRPLVRTCYTRACNVDCISEVALSYAYSRNNSLSAFCRILLCEDDGSGSLLALLRECSVVPFLNVSFFLMSGKPV